MLKAIYGKSGSGKTTLAKKLASDNQATIIKAGEWDGDSSFEYGFDLMLLEVLQGKSIIFDSMKNLLINATGKLSVSFLGTEWKKSISIDSVETGEYLTAKLKNGNYAVGFYVNEKEKLPVSVSFHNFKLDLSTDHNVFVAELYIDIEKQRVIQCAKKFELSEVEIFYPNFFSPEIKKTGMRELGISNSIFYYTQRLNDLTNHFSSSLIIIVNPLLEDDKTYKNMLLNLIAAIPIVHETIKSATGYSTITHDRSKPQKDEGTIVPDEKDWFVEDAEEDTYDNLV